LSTKTLSTGKGKKSSPPRRRTVRKRRLGVGILAVAVVGVAIIVLGVIYFLSNSGGSSAGTNQAGKYAFQVGSPGPGEQAPAIRLPSTAGGMFDLAALRGKTVLLYFQEGLTCQPCWDQLKDIESKSSEFHALGIDTMVSITTDPLDALKQKVVDEGLSTPVLSDPGLVASKTYSANGYGMMGGSRDGHTFILVGPDGRIRWRADYGGAPDFTMYVPVANLIADIRAGLNGSSS
jgi:peroxiredoxin